MRNQLTVDLVARSHSAISLFSYTATVGWLIELIFSKLKKSLKSVRNQLTVDLVGRSHSAIFTHNYVPYLSVGCQMGKRSVNNWNLFKINQEEYTSPTRY